jgi:hypothetical protein
MCLRAPLPRSSPPLAMEEEDDEERLYLLSKTLEAIAN